LTQRIFPLEHGVCVADLSWLSERVTPDHHPLPEVAQLWVQGERVDEVEAASATAQQHGPDSGIGEARSEAGKPQRHRLNSKAAASAGASFVASRVQVSDRADCLA
jgi:hypothetical protein